MEINKPQSVIQFYVLCNKLKNVIRSGWKNWNVKRERVESVAEHIFGVQILAIAMHSQYEYNLDLYKIIYMLAIHELEEIIIGDLTAWDISEENKLEQGHKAISEVLSGLLEKVEIEKLILEFDAKETEEALFAYHCDKLECDIQCKLYDEEGCVDMSNQRNNPIYYDKKVQDIIENGDTSWSSMWLEYDRNKFSNDDNFMEVLDYIKNNKINLNDTKNY